MRDAQSDIGPLLLANAAEPQKILAGWSASPVSTHVDTVGSHRQMQSTWRSERLALGDAAQRDIAPLEDGGRVPGERQMESREHRRLELRRLRGDVAREIEPVEMDQIHWEL